MDGVPDCISATFERLKKEYPFYVALKHIVGAYYVYRVSSRWDADEKRPKSVSDYMGRIRENGDFVKTSASLEDKLERAKALIRANGGTVLLKEEKETQKAATQDQSIEGLKVNPMEERIIKALSMNSRLTMQEIGDIVGADKQEVYNAVRRLEKRFGIKYAPVIDVTKLGFSWFVGLVKFDETKPSVNEIKETFEPVSQIQLVTLTNGEYDILFIFCAENNDEASSLIYEMRRNSKLRNYQSTWHIAPFDRTYEFIPIRDQFFELLKNKVWKRSKERPRQFPNELTYNQFNVLRTLNLDAGQGFVNVDRAGGMAEGTTSYVYDKLKERGVIVRTTINMEKLPVKYYAAILTEFTNMDAFEKSRHNLLSEIIENNKDSPINRYLLVGDVLAPESVILMFPVIREHQLREASTRVKECIKGVKVKELIITDIVLGTFFQRKYDNTHSDQARILAESYGIETFRENKVNYNSTKDKKSSKKNEKLLAINPRNLQVEYKKQ